MRERIRQTPACSSEQTEDDEAAFTFLNVRTGINSIGKANILSVFQDQICCSPRHIIHVLRKTALETCFMML